MRYKLLTLTLILMAGCGSQGALYLPEEEPDVNQPAARASTAQDNQAAEDEEDDQP